MLRNPNDYQLGYSNMLFLIEKANSELIEMIFNKTKTNSRKQQNLI